MKTGFLLAEDEAIKLRFSNFYTELKQITHIGELSINTSESIINTLTDFYLRPLFLSTYYFY